VEPRRHEREGGLGSLHPGQIIGGGHQTAYTVNGEAWDVDMGWVRMPEKDLPVPPGDVKLIFTEGGQVWVITTSDGLYRTGLGPDWTFLGAFPGSSTATAKASWGGVKSRWR
jgi:hypothetical protein